MKQFMRCMIGTLLVATVFSTLQKIRQEYFSNQTETITTSLPLASMDVPLVLKVIVDDLIDLSEIKKNHKNLFGYFMGKINENRTFVQNTKWEQNGPLGWGNIENNVSAQGNLLVNKIRTYIHNISRAWVIILSIYTKKFSTTC